MAQVSSFQLDQINPSRKNNKNGQRNRETTHPSENFEKYYFRMVLAEMGCSQSAI
jgi:hypothetical protein